MRQSNGCDIVTLHDLFDGLGASWFNYESGQRPAFNDSQYATSSLSAVEKVAKGCIVVCQEITQPPRKMASP